VLEYLEPLSRGIVNTLLITAGAFAIGAVIGIPVAIARSARLRAVRVLAISYVEVMRGIPPIAWLFIAFYGLAQFDIRIASLPAAIAGLGVISGAYLAEIYRAGMRAVPKGQWEAARASGMTERQLYTAVIAPQALVTVTPPAATYGIGLLKDSAIASVIGAQEVTALALSETQRGGGEGLSVFLAAALIYLAISVPLGLASRRVDARLEQRLAHA
jgi:His/Glu/Gln/Arg/opine family amino acid ABC transporter permease subunit